MTPHNKPHLGKEEELAAQRVIRSGWLAQGNEVEAFENEVCNFLALPDGHAVALSNGTSALYLALWALTAEGQKVAIPAYACSALRNAVAMAHCEEIVLDSASGTPNMDLAVLKASGADCAIVPHMFGIPLDLSGLTGLNIIEDCAQSIGAILNGLPTGVHGRIGVFSFYATKLITSGGQGGMLVSKDKNIVDLVRDYRQFDCRRDDKQRFNFQMTDLQAAIGREQLSKLPGFLAARKRVFEAYSNAGIQLLGAGASNNANTSPARYRAVVVTEKPQEIITALHGEGIKAIVPVEDWELLGDGSHFPNALKLTKRTVSLPIYPSLSNKDVTAIIRAALYT